MFLATCTASELYVNHGFTLDKLGTSLVALGREIARLAHVQARFLP